MFSLILSVRARGYITDAHSVIIKTEFGSGFIEDLLDIGRYGISSTGGTSNDTSTRIRPVWGGPTINVQHPVRMGERQNTPVLYLRQQRGVQIVVGHHTWCVNGSVRNSVDDRGGAVVVSAPAVSDLVDPGVVLEHEFVPLARVVVERTWPPWLPAVQTAHDPPFTRHLAHRSQVLNSLVVSGQAFTVHGALGDTT